MSKEINSYEEEEEYIKIIQRQASRIKDLEAKLARGGANMYSPED